MFFKMLKSDLKRNRGLNFILFVFMIAAAAFVYVSTAQIYTILTQNKRTTQVCHSSDFIGSMTYGSSQRDEKIELLEREIAKKGTIDNYYRNEYAHISGYQLDFADFDEEDDKDLLEYYKVYISKSPQKYDIVADLDDNEVIVPNGCIAVPITLAKEVDAEVGDKMKLTTDMGNVYELEICSFIKDPLSEEEDIFRLILSDADYDLLSPDFPIKTDMWSFNKTVGTDQNDAIVSVMDIRKTQDIFIDIMPSGMTNLNATRVILYVLAAFIVVISIFIILIIFMTIRFTIIAALKNEEREIGVMRALGVDSFGFRWLFIAKYIFFAIVGGVIGIFAGAPLSKLLMRTFSENYAYPDVTKMTIIGIIGAAVNVCVIILFAMRVMRRINKISVINAIRGENHGERFGKTSVISLSKRKKMSVPMFLALSDVLTRLKRYLFPVIAYTLSMLILLLVYNLRNSIVNKGFIKYMNLYQYDFQMDFDRETSIEVNKRAEKNEINMYAEINKELAEAGIPAHLDYHDFTISAVDLGNDDRFVIYTFFHVNNQKAGCYRKGSRRPVLDNEIALSYFTANKKGIRLGDTVKVDVDIADEGGISFHRETREFVVTGFFDYLESGVPAAFIGGRHDDFKVITQYLSAYIIDAPESEHAAVIEQMRGLFGEHNIITAQKGIENDLKRYDVLLTLLKYSMSIILLFITMFITYLYENIFIAEETSEAAIMKSMGFSDGSVKKWQLLRMLILALGSVVLAQLLFRTAGVAAARALFRILSLSGFGFVFEFPVTFVGIPVLFTAAIMGVTCLKVRSIDNVAVWNIADE